jgi:hypothetical protein
LPFISFADLELVITGQDEAAAFTNQADVKKFAI